MTTLNQLAPDFELPDVNDVVRRLSDYREKIVILNFWSCECPHSERVDKDVATRMMEWGANVVMLSIASNRNETIEAVKNIATARNLPNVLMDAECVVADLYEAQTTPHIFIIDRDGILRYRGAADDSTFRQRTPTRFFLNEAVESLRAGQIPPVAESPAYGCAIVREI